MSKKFENLAIFPGSELELIRSFMASEKVPESKWLFGSGLDFDDLLSSESAISLKQFDVIYRNVYRLSNRPGLGIDFGLALNLSRWGMLSSALLCANTLGHALAIADEFKEILRSRFVISTQEKGTMLVIHLSPNSDLHFPVSQIFAYEVFVGSLQTQISQLLGKQFRFSDVKVPYSKPLNTTSYKKISEKPVQFEASSGQLSIPLELVRKTLPMTNRVTRKVIVSHCREELDRVKNARNGDIVFTVRSMLAQTQGDLPSLQVIASKLSISPRTLRRRLQQEQVQYRHLCEQERQQRAVLLLSSNNLSLKEVGESCGFKDSPSFHKAFKRWTGETPSKYKQHLLSLDKRI